MENYLRKYTKEFMVGVAVVLLALTIGVVAWTIMDVSSAVNGVVVSGSSSEMPVGFNLSGATNLNLKGLLQQ